MGFNSSTHIFVSDPYLINHGGKQAISPNHWGYVRHFSVQRAINNRSTTANSGIGFELARQLLLTDSKCHVLLGSRSIEKGENAIKELQAQQPLGAVELLQVDVASEESVAAAAKEVEKQYGKHVGHSLDLLPPPAKVYSRTKPLMNCLDLMH